LEVEPGFVPALVSLALIRATSVDESLRDGPAAVELADRACALTQARHPEALHALAAAYAEVGRFADALGVGQSAVEAALAGGNRPLAAAIEQSLQAYRQGRPFREPAEASGPVPG